MVYVLLATPLAQKKQKCLQFRFLRAQMSLRCAMSNSHVVIHEGLSWPDILLSYSFCQAETAIANKQDENLSSVMKYAQSEARNNKNALLFK